MMAVHWVTLEPFFFTLRGDIEVLVHTCTQSASIQHSALQSFIEHPKRPDALRIDQLREPWEEGALDKALELRKKEPGLLEFVTSCAFLPPALFNKEPSFEKSVFVPGALPRTYSCVH